MPVLELHELPPRSQEKRLAIIDAAQTLFLEHGFGATSMDAVAETARVSKRTVYSHFDSKAALFGSVMTKMCTLMGGGGMSALGFAPDEECAGKLIMGDVSGLDHREVLYQLAARFTKLITDPGAVALFRVVIGEAGRFPELGNAFFRNGPEPLSRSLADYLQSLDEQNVLRVPNPHDAAWRFITMAKEPLHMEILLGEASTPTEATMDEVAKKAVADFLEIYAVETPAR